MPKKAAAVNGLFHFGAPATGTEGKRKKTPKT
jgi:hypothetical protein